MKANVIDITERRQAVEDLKNLNDKLENRVIERTLELTHALEREKELNEIKSRFVSMASHEFRTPLSTILSSISLLERYTEDNEEEKRKKHIDRIKQSVRNLTGILEDFLSLDTLEQGKVGTFTETFDLYNFSMDIKGRIEGILKPGQYITYQHRGENEVMLDKRILENILANLLSNAIKYSHENNAIELRTIVSDDIVQITVLDFGIGIPKSDQKDLFKMFHRAKNANTIQGTGLGLNIVKRYVELLDGTISFQSKINKGATFIIEFPRNN